MGKKIENINKVHKRVNKRVERKKLRKKKFNYKSGDYFEVERICARKVENGVIKYNVKWEGWPESTNTWEPIGHLLTVRELVIKYELALGNGKIYTLCLEIPEELREEVDKVIANDDKDSEGSFEDPYGSLDYQDVPQKILRMENRNDEFLALVEWAVRKNSGIKPISSYVERYVLRKKKPLLLIDYYESKMKWAVK
jgi:hypothetical protein